MSSSATSSAPRHAACATAVRAITRSARIPSTSKAAQSAAIRRNSLSGNVTELDRGPRRCDAPGQLGVGVGIALGESGGIGLVRHPLPDDVDAHVDVAGRMDVDGQPEPVQQLRAQLALFGVHGADEHEARVVAVRDAVTLDMHPTHRRGVEQHVDQVVVQQIDLVDIEHAAVGAGQQSRGERMLAVAQHLLQIQRTDHAVLGRADRQLDESAAVHRGQHLRQAPHRGRFRGALLAADQHAADLRMHRAQQQRQPKAVVADDRTERVASWLDHRDVRDAVVEEFLAVTDESVWAYMSSR